MSHRVDSYSPPHREQTEMEAKALAEKVRAACIESALRGYENAQISGLCREGAWEAAISAIRILDLKDLVSESKRLE